MNLNQFWEKHPKAAIAFSGGVDSAYLLYSAVHSGAVVKAYYAKTAFQPQFELKDAQKLASQLGAELEILPLDVLSVPHVRENPSNRCYYCKKALFSAISAAALADGFPLLLDGTNASDPVSDRPGMQALKELSVRSPLRECGLTKGEIRQLSKEAGLFTHNKPAYACLATRIPTGDTITPEKLRRTEAAETFLHALGLRDYRVRTLGDIARIQVTPTDLPIVLENREIIVTRLKQSYSGVVLDLEVRP
ncbi:MAG: ATP-dependent sacrificial sulfur transferase LarE [Candidatus Faecousia sp.]|nr:ATP-dependent sacrificial sulfur transferase LarE [Candidatus Faecousia sp.]